MFKYAAEVMTDGGSIMTISSLTARLPGPGLAVCARAGIDYAIKIAAVEYGEQNIRFNSIAAVDPHRYDGCHFEHSDSEERFIPHPLGPDGYY